VNSLDPKVQAHLKRFFPGKNLGDIRVHIGIPHSIMRLGLGSTKAVTFGNDIYFREGAYDPKTARGLSLIAHEVAHTVQYDKYGKIGFLKAYAAEFQLLRSRGLSPYDAYQNISFEILANSKQTEVFNALRASGLP